MKPDIPTMTQRSDRRLMMGLAQSGLELLVRELGLALFRQPALEMLFDLYNKPEAEPRYLTALCGVSSTSERNSQRIVHRMEQHGLVETGPDVEDGRRTIVSLTPLGRRAIERFLDEWAASSEFKALVDEQLMIRRVTSALNSDD
ncbi:MarR family winged helix-turn-helix transcriptional regulator [Novosphingobium sp. ZW T3_23]|uniref:MarR family winged helix-turn-helix transcriptional regulator n=1 Tax=Novosphingobium sp. ZW T3_23 TaxID=3378084 RepID=UPI003852F3C3